jgi:hypothetical protein
MAVPIEGDDGLPVWRHPGLAHGRATPTFVLRFSAKAASAVIERRTGYRLRLDH